MDALHFLQEQDVGRQPVQLLLELMDDHAPRQVREAFVDVVGRDGEFHRRAAANGEDHYPNVTASPTCHRLPQSA